MTIEPKRADIGRAVEYCAGYPGARPEPGVLEEFNAYVAFVRYGQDQHGKATAFTDLRWPEKRKQQKQQSRRRYVTG